MLAMHNVFTFMLQGTINSCNMLQRNIQSLIYVVVASAHSQIVLDGLYRCTNLFLASILFVLEWCYAG